MIGAHIDFLRASKIVRDILKENEHVDLARYTRKVITQLVPVTGMSITIETLDKKGLQRLTIPESLASVPYEYEVSIADDLPGHRLNHKIVILPIALTRRIFAMNDVTYPKEGESIDYDF